MKIIIIISFTAYILLSASYAATLKSETVFADTVAISKAEFAASPFGFRLTLDNFENIYAKTLKRQRYFMRNETNSSQIDTIYRFRKGKTKIFFYKPGRGRYDGMIMGGVIRMPQVELNNGIRTGISRKEFFGKFSDWFYDESDSLTLESPATACTFTFVFSRNKLKEIKITVGKDS